jgi:membrane protein
MKSAFATFFDRISRHQITSLSGSLAFFTALSLAPLLILFVTVSAGFSPEFQKTFTEQAQALVGTEASRSINTVIENAKSHSDLVTTYGVLGIATLLLSASLIFGELRLALNRIFEVEISETANADYVLLILDFIKKKIFQIALALAFVLSLIISLLASSYISARVHTGKLIQLGTINTVVSFVFYLMFFTLLFHFLPARRMPWRQVYVGGTLTAFFFVAGKELIGMYLGKSAIGSSYGAAGSVIVLLVWVYYSTLITLLGAEISAMLPEKLKTKRRSSRKQIVHSSSSSPVS